MLFNANWYDDAQGIILENASRQIPVGEANEQFTAYAYYAEGAPKAVSADQITWTIDADGTGLSIDANGLVTGSAAAGTAVVHAVVTDKPELSAAGVIVVA